MKFVRVGSFPSRIEADMIASLLQGSGIPSQVRSDDAGGVDPALALVTGVEVLVPEDEVTFAMELIGNVSKGQGNRPQRG
jgi:hypothetical protein